MREAMTEWRIGGRAGYVVVEGSRRTGSVTSTEAISVSFSRLLLVVCPSSFVLLLFLGRPCLDSDPARTCDQGHPTVNRYCQSLSQSAPARSDCHCEARSGVLVFWRCRFLLSEVLFVGIVSPSFVSPILSSGRHPMACLARGKTLHTKQDKASQTKKR